MFSRSHSSRGFNVNRFLQLRPYRDVIGNWAERIERSFPETPRIRRSDSKIILGQAQI